MKKDVLALTNAITDIFIEVSDQELKELGFKKGVVNDKELFYAHPDFQRLEKSAVKIIPGGSPANVAHSTAVLGLKSGLAGTVGNDELGREYKRDVKKSGLENLLATGNGRSGVCYILVTPDGEKTPVPDIRVAKKFSFDKKKLLEYSIFHTSAYELITNPGFVLDIMRDAKKKGLELSFDLADPAIPRIIRKDINEALGLVDYLTLTEKELESYTGLDQERSIRELQGKHKILAIKKGEQGSEIITPDARYKIDRVPVNVINTTGAGDTYLAGILYGVPQGWHPKDCGRMGSYVAAQVCGQVGARLCRLR
jgi:hypothetical protein